MPHRRNALLIRQLAQSRLDSEDPTLWPLLALINDSYEQHEKDLRRIDRANRLMAEELEEMLDLREQADQEQNKRLAELEQAYAALAAQEARATHLAYHDALTGLPNRAFLADKLNQACDAFERFGLPVAVHCIDLDQFKAINDTFGHHVGDELIRAVAERLNALCAPQDTLARLGGDEFAIIQPYIHLGSATSLADRIIRSIGQPVSLSVGVVHVGCSVGVAMLDTSGVQPMDFLRRADLALYQAKESGRGRYAMFETAMDAAVQFKRSLQNDLRAALAADDIHLAFQPQMTPQGELVGVEALARWSHPTRGAIPPSQFVAAAEECGLILELGAYVLKRAFRAGRRWPGLKIAVNLSPRQMRMRDFVPNILSWLNEAGVSASQFELEITESTLMDDDPETLEQLHRLRQLGFGLALDDFGTGYSSLSYLQRYPITKVKIDRTFTARLGRDDSTIAVIGAIFNLASALRLDVVAEGVETTSQLEALGQAGACTIQGFLFSPPASETRIDDLLANSAISRRIPVTEPRLRATA